MLQLQAAKPCLRRSHLQRPACISLKPSPIISNSRPAIAHKRNWSPLLNTLAVPSLGSHRALHPNTHTPAAALAARERAHKPCPAVSRPQGRRLAVPWRAPRCGARLPPMPRSRRTTATQGHTARRAGAVAAGTPTVTVMLGSQERDANIAPGLVASS
jgi:hypothetical protein